MKILFLNPGAHLGGAERSLLDLMSSLTSAGDGLSACLIAGADGPLVARARAVCSEVAVVPLPSALARLGDAGAGGPAGNQSSRAALVGGLCAATPTGVVYAARLRRAITAFHPDVVHSNGFKMHVLGAWATPRGVPVVWYLHDYVGARPLMSRLLRAHVSRCALAVANSNSVADDARAALGARLAVKPVYYSVDLDTFTPDGSALALDRLAAMPPAPAGTVRVGLAATFARWKGHEVFLRALAALPRGIALRAYIIGGPVYRSRGSQLSVEGLRALAAELGVAGMVGFTGFIDDPAPALRALDIAVHASTEPEPFGLAIAEAMACGRAVIAADGGGAAEIVTPGVDGLTHPRGDHLALAQRIVELATTPELRAGLGRAARLTAEARFRRERLAREMVPIYREVARA
jgi:glycosyltransferase involved in cell wall biosynthesis